MKDMITTIASIMILMIFVLQFVTNQITYTKLAGSGSYVKQFEHIAVEAGEVSAENIQNLRRNAAQVLNCLPDEIHIDVKEAESETYVYDVRVPLKNIIGAAKMLGISEEENRVEYHFKESFWRQRRTRRMKNLIMTMGIMILFCLLLKFQTELNIIFVQNI